MCVPSPLIQSAVALSGVSETVCSSVSSGLASISCLTCLAPKQILAIACFILRLDSINTKTRMVTTKT